MAEAATFDPSTLAGGLDAYSGGAAIGSASFFAVACTIVVVLRFVTQIYVQRIRLGWEDWLLIPAWVLLMGFCANVILTVKIGGVGRHEAYILKNEPKTLAIWAQLLLTTELFYGITIAFLKSSILALYLRLFGVEYWFRIATWGCIAFVWAWAVTELLTAVFQCEPIAYQWDKSLHGNCFDQLVFFRFISLPNVIHDVAMIILPLPAVWKLQINTNKKLALSSVFLVGTMGCIASFVRLSIFWNTDAFMDKTWVSVELMAWTIAEPGMICICACAPVLWPLIRMAHGRGKTSRQTGYTAQRPYASGRGGKEQLPHNGDDFIPLKDSDGRGATIEVSGSQSGDFGPPVSGIKVTKDISWTSSPA